MPSKHQRQSHPFEAFDSLGLARKRDTESLETVLSYGGKTVPPLLVAAITGDAAMMRDLLSDTRQLDASDGIAGQAVHLVVQSGLHKDGPDGGLAALQLLLEAGANPNVADEDGMTPLMIAAMKGDLNAVRLLAQHKADLAAVNAAGLTASQLAVGDKRLRIQKLLRDIVGGKTTA